LFQIAAFAFVAQPLIWLVSRTGQRIRIDEVLALLAALAATAVMVRSFDARPWADVGLSRRAARVPILGRGWCVGFAAIGAACAMLFAAGWLRIAPSEPGSSLAAAARITLFLVPAALAEEVLCRGYLLTVLRDRLGTWIAVAATSLAFGVLHVSNPGWTVASVGIVTLAGIFLAAVRVAYDSLYAAWAAHLAWNWVMAVPLHAPVSGLRFESPDYRAVETGPDWITGGAWGPEGGVAAVIGMLACLYYLYARHRREES
jgi:membrane protease YdiL (CAAX protease family)